MDGKPNLLKAPSDWNKKPDVGYIAHDSQPKKNDTALGVPAIDGTKPPPFSISKTPSQSETKPQLKPSPPVDHDTDRKFGANTKDKPKEEIKPMTGLSSANHSLDMMKNSFTHQIPSLTLRSHYKDSKLFEVMQQGILQVGLNK